MRALIPALCLVATFGLCGSSLICAQGIVDCVYPGHVAVSRIEGEVFDPFGVVVPGVVVSLVSEQGSTLQTKTDNEGRFRLAASAGNYSFRAVFPMFQASQTELSVGEDLAGLVHPSNLRVILGMTGSFCSWVTTSQKEFRNIINSNKKRSEESAKKHATQK